MAKKQEKDWTCERITPCLIIVSLDMLLCGLFVALSVVDRQYLSFGPENHPPPPPALVGCGNGLTIYCLVTWPRRQRTVRRYPRTLIWALESWAIEQLVLPIRTWHSLLNKCAWTWIVTIFILYHYHLSSSARNLTTCFNPRSESKLFAFFQVVIICQNFAMFLHQFCQWENFILKPIWV